MYNKTDVQIDIGFGYFEINREQLDEFVQKVIIPLGYSLMSVDYSCGMGYWLDFSKDDRTDYQIYRAKKRLTCRA